MKNAIILCSGGMDSVVTAHYVSKVLKYKNLHIIFFNYGQKSLIQERRCSRLCAKQLKAKFFEISLPELSSVSTSLINKKGNSKIEKKDLKDTKKESSKWYVPCRNLLFLAYSFSYAESIFIKSKSKSDIFIGFKCEGKESYPDTTPKFIKSINFIAKGSCLYPIKVYAPLIKKDKEDIVSLGKKIGVNFKDTFSCYTGKNRHCGGCLSCRLRKEGFYWSGINDPTAYQL